MNRRRDILPQSCKSKSVMAYSGVRRKSAEVNADIQAGMFGASDGLVGSVFGCISNAAFEGLSNNALWQLPYWSAVKKWTALSMIPYEQKQEEKDMLSNSLLNDNNAKPGKNGDKSPKKRWQPLHRVVNYMSKQSRTVRSHLADRRSRVNKHTHRRGAVRYSDLLRANVVLPAFLLFLLEVLEHS